MSPSYINNNYSRMYSREEYWSKECDLPPTPPDYAPGVPFGLENPPRQYGPDYAPEVPFGLENPPRQYGPDYAPEVPFGLEDPPRQYGPQPASFYEYDTYGSNSRMDWPPEYELTPWARIPREEYWLEAYELPPTPPDYAPEVPFGLEDPPRQYGPQPASFYDTYGSNSRMDYPPEYEPSPWVRSRTPREEYWSEEYEPSPWVRTPREEYRSEEYDWDRTPREEYWSEEYESSPWAPTPREEYWSEEYESSPWVHTPREEYWSEEYEPTQALANYAPERLSGLEDPPRPTARQNTPFNDTNGRNVGRPSTGRLNVDLRCSICNRDFNSEEQRLGHLVGSQHARKVQAEVRKSAEKLKAMEKVKIQKIIADQKNRIKQSDRDNGVNSIVRCDTCDITHISSERLHCHLSGRMHLLCLREQLRRRCHPGGPHQPKSASRCHPGGLHQPKSSSPRHPGGPHQPKVLSRRRRRAGKAAAQVGTAAAPATNASARATTAGPSPAAFAAAAAAAVTTASATVTTAATGCAAKTASAAANDDQLDLKPDIKILMVKVEPHVQYQ